MKQGRLRRF